MRQQYQWRSVVLIVFFALLGLSILVQIVRIQTSEQANDFRDIADLYSGYYRTFYPARGDIYDRDGHLLAGNRTVYEVGVNLRDIKNPETIALTVSVTLGMNYDNTLALLKNPPMNTNTIPPQPLVYLVLKDFVTPENAEYLKEVKQNLDDNYTPGGDSLAGLEFKPRLARSYPEKSIAANMLGFVNFEGRGYFGVEEKYNDLLAGVPVRMWVPSNPNRVEEIPVIPSGASLVLTIDREVQLAVEDILDRSVASTGSVSGTIIVMHPQTGEILAMASTPQLDLNQFWQYGQVYNNAMEFNRGISQIYEPGSIYKVFTLAAALDSGAVNANSSYLDIGYYSLGGAAIYNWDQGAWGPQNLVGCMQHSLNVCMSWLADTMGPETFYTYMRRFGIGHPTGTDMSGEAAGRLKVPGDADWHLVDLATNSFGQGVAVTPIQMLMAASSIANEGKMVLPHVVRSIVSNGRQNDSSVQVIGTPISAQSARLTTEILATALENGESLGLVPGYRIAGKTGTAQIPAPNGLYLSDQINASFIGWGPVDDPQFMVFVWLEKPQSEDWASLVAAPVFKEVVERIVVLLDIPPDAIRSQLNGQ